MEKLLLVATILYPLIISIVCLIIKKETYRNYAIVFSSIFMIVVSLGLGYYLMKPLVPPTIRLSINLSVVGIFMKLLDFALLIYITYIAFKFKKPLIIVLTLIQFFVLLIFDGVYHPKEPQVQFILDRLSLIMVLLVSIIGTIITVFAIGYMREHEQHQQLEHSKQPKFFFILMLFISAMNAIVITNDLSHMYFFWEVTTLCSFLLISHDQTEQSIKNAFRALWINMLGGVAFVVAIIFIYHTKNTLSIKEITTLTPGSSFSGIFAVGIALLCFAGFTKSAQFPFQSWLLGAMVAPTPVSALLHSSTMVKAGVYLIVRFSPTFNGTMLASIIAVIGGFTFFIGSAIAISQQNSKRVLAYSTIANLGLIVCCAGIGSYIAIGAAILLMIFHAISKGLLFLCIGTIEHGIGSRDIEDMQGLMKKMPFTTVITTIAMVSMLLPPFGVLLTKWLAIEASVRLPIVLLLIILGSAFTVVFWGKWIGIILTLSYKSKYYVEKLSNSIKYSLVVLVVMVLFSSIAISPIFNSLVEPYLMGVFGISFDATLLGQGGIWIIGGASNVIGGFAPLYFFLLLAFIAFVLMNVVYRFKSESIKLPYLCGENTDDIRGIEFIGPKDNIENVIVRNYYLTGVFGEKNLTLWANFISGAIIIVMFGVVL